MTYEGAHRNYKDPNLRLAVLKAIAESVDHDAIAAKADVTAADVAMTLVKVLNDHEIEIRKDHPPGPPVKLTDVLDSIDPPDPEDL